MKNTHSTDVERRGANDDDDEAMQWLLKETAEGECSCRSYVDPSHSSDIASGRVFCS
jgi:hypothetical protein